MSEYKLAEQIIQLSVANTWDEAKLEWQLEEIYRQEEPDTCLCGHSPRDVAAPYIRGAEVAGLSDVD